MEHSRIVVCGEEVAEGIRVLGGNTLQFQIVCSDNDALSQLKLDIHNNFDCHGHGSVLVPSFPVPAVENITEDMNKQTIFPLTGRDTTILISVEIPENVTSGSYHLGFQLIDISGNAAENIFLDVQMLHPLDTIPPVVTVDSINNVSNTIKRGDVLTLSGSITDNKPLGSGGNGVVFMNYTNLSTGNIFSTDSYVTMENNTSTDTTFTLNYKIPLFLVKGDYKFSVVGADGVRNISNTIDFTINVQ